jgi:hypothetical protein
MRFLLSSASATSVSASSLAVSASSLAFSGLFSSISLFLDLRSYLACDDLTTNEVGVPQIGQGVAEDRIVSLTDVEMRHGRESASQRFEGRKLSRRRTHQPTRATDEICWRSLTQWKNKQA